MQISTTKTPINEISIPLQVPAQKHDKNKRIDLRNVNMSECDLRVSVDGREVQRELKGSQTFGGDDLAMKLGEEGISNHSQTRKQFKFDEDENQDDDADDMDEVLSMRPEKLDLKQLTTF